MRVLFADKLPDRARTRLAAAGFVVLVEPGLAGAALAERLADLEPEILVVRSTKVHSEHAAAGRRLALVIRAGAGVNTIDLDACSGRGIFVANCPGKNAVAVAELTLALVLALDRFVPANVDALRRGEWNKAAFSQGRGLNGRVLAILGVGAIGREVASRALAFGMRVVAWSRSLTDEAAEEMGVTRVATPEAAARRADVLSVHLALTSQTRGLVGESILDALPHGALFVNTSRAEVVDEAALLRVLDHKGVRAGLDVFSGEPATGTGAFEHPLARHPSVYGTHHIGASTLEAQEAVGDEVCRIAETFRDEGRVLNRSNAIVRSAATHRVVIRHLDRVGVLAGVLDQLRQASINVQEMENIVFPGGAAVARVQVSSAPGSQVIEQLIALEHVLDASVVAL